MSQAVRSAGSRMDRFRTQTKAHQSSCCLTQTTWPAPRKENTKSTSNGDFTRKVLSLRFAEGEQIMNIRPLVVGDGFISSDHACMSSEPRR